MYDTLREWQTDLELASMEKAEKSTAYEIGLALASINSALIKMEGAVGAASGYPMEDRVQSFVDQLLDYESELKKLQEKLERGYGF